MLPEGSNGIPCAAQGAAKVTILSRERMAPLNPQENARGLAP